MNQLAILGRDGQHDIGDAAAQRIDGRALGIVDQATAGKITADGIRIQ